MARAVDSFFAKLAGTLNSYLHNGNGDYKINKAAFMALLPEMIRQGYQGEFVLFYQEKPQFYYKDLTEIDHTRIRALLEHQGDDYFIFPIRKEFLDYGYGRIIAPKLNGRSFVGNNTNNEGIESKLISAL